MENFASLEERDIDKNVEIEDVLYKLHIAHEIAMSSNPAQVNLEDLLPNDPLAKQVQYQVHSAFWGLFREELSSDPVKYDMALSLIKDIKENLHAVMTPNLSKLKNKVDEVLDDELLRQQVEHDAIDVQSYAQFVISVMKNICAPVRDKDVENLTTLTDIVDIFRGILETLNKMKLDLMNFSLKTVTPELLANQLEYERKKFSEYCELIGGKLPITEGWIKRNKENAQNATQDEILHDAFMELLTWGKHEPLPETLAIDAPRLNIIKNEHYNLIVSASITIMSLSCLPSDLSTDASFKQLLKERIAIFMNGLKSDESVKSMIPDLIQEVKKQANIRMTEQGRQVLSDYVVQGLTEQLMSIISPENKIRTLVTKRVNEYLKASLKATNGNGPFPLALVLFKNELESLNAKFKHLVLHSITICGTLYSEFLQD